MKKKSQFDYDLLVIGSGAGGSVAAHITNRAGLRVGVVEADLMGGECPNIGCVPTKALLHAADVYWQAKHAQRFGLRTNTIGYNYPALKAWKQTAVERTGTSLGEQMYVSEGIEVIRGKAHFLDSHTISVGTTRLRAKKFLIATGSQTIVPRIPGLAEAGYLTYREALELSRPPRSIAIIGGGPIGVEFATLLASFGSKVYIIESAPRLIAHEEPEASELLERTLTQEYSASVYTSVTVDRIERQGPKRVLTFRANKRHTHIKVDEILVATGKQGVVDIGLINAGVAHTPSAIKVNEYMQTSQPHIYAAGDCVGPYLFTHMSTYQSKIAAHNMLHPKKPLAASYHSVPRCVFSSPEIAAVGATESDLKLKRVAYTSALAPLSIIGRSNTTDTSNGFVKVLASKKTGVLLGATVVCPHAGEVLHELALAITHHMTAEQVAQTIHAFPTWSEAVRVACTKLAKQL